LTRLVLDTSAYSQFQRGHPEAVRRLDAASWIGVPTITIGELETGFRLGRQYETNRDVFALFLANSAVEVLPVDENSAQI